MNLPHLLAMGMADGRTTRLPRLTRGASPEFARELLDALYVLRDRLSAIRLDEGASWNLLDRIAFASVVQEVEEAIVDARRWLSRLARRGGHGVPLARVSEAGGAGAAAPACGVQR